jgi:hypothetical protein
MRVSKPAIDHLAPNLLLTDDQALLVIFVINSHQVVERTVVALSTEVRSNGHSGSNSQQHCQSLIMHVNCIVRDSALR